MMHCGLGMQYSVNWRTTLFEIGVHYDDDQYDDAWAVFIIYGRKGGYRWNVEMSKKCQYPTTHKKLAIPSRKNRNLIPQFVFLTFLIKKIKFTLFSCNFFPILLNYFIMQLCPEQDKLTKFCLLYKEGTKTIEHHISYFHQPVPLPVKIEQSLCIPPILSYAAAISVVTQRVRERCVTTLIAAA